MNIKGQSLAMNMIVARSQGASVRPALLGSLVKYPFPGLFFTLMLARREVESLPATTPGPAQEPVFVPDREGREAEEARAGLKHLGVNVRVTDLDGVELHGNLRDYIVIRQRPADVEVPVGSLITLRVISKEEFDRFSQIVRELWR